MSFVLVGHRGAPSEVTENTVESFRRAEQLGVDQIETDVRISADGVLFLLHDATLDRTAEDGQPSLCEVAGLTFDQISSVALRGGLRVPTLDQLYAPTTIGIELEIKAIEAVDALAAFFVEHPAAAARTTITSFQVEALQRLAERSPELPRMVIAPRYTVAAEHPGGAAGLVAEAGAGGLACGVEGLSPEAVRALQRDGVRVHVWPIKDAAAMARAAELGADGGTTDFAREAIGWARQAGLR